MVEAAASGGGCRQCWRRLQPVVVEAATICRRGGAAAARTGAGAELDHALAGQPCAQPVLRVSQRLDQHPRALPHNHACAATAAGVRGGMLVCGGKWSCGGMIVCGVMCGGKWSCGGSRSVQLAGVHAWHRTLMCRTSMAAQQACATTTRCLCWRRSSSHRQRSWDPGSRPPPRDPCAARGFGGR